MGCCGSSLDKGEEEIRSILINTGLWEISYEDLREKISDNEYLESILRLFVNNSFRDGSFGKYHKTIVDLLKSHIMEKGNSKYYFIFYLFSFLAQYSLSNSKEHFYLLLIEVENKSLTIEQILTYLKDYYIFNLVNVTETIISEMKDRPNHDKAVVLKAEENLKTVFTIDNINTELEEMKKQLSEHIFDTTSHLTSHQFKSIHSLYLSHSDMRDHFLFKYSKK
jgi:hypothetical protein